MSRLWDRGSDLDAAVARFTAGRDPELDLRLVPYDALASMAHATMLAEIGVLEPADLEGLRGELAAVVEDCRSGRFRIAWEDEDGHTALENRLTERLGDVGRRIHTGRSRNDQVLAALRLYGREAVLAVEDATLAVIDTLLTLAGDHAETALPGYTHQRQAMPSTLGFLFAAHAEALLDNLPWLAAAFRHLDRSPLGSASGYGVALPLDRQRVADLLRFDRVQTNTLAVQNDRGTGEGLVLTAVAAPAAIAARLAADLIWLSSDELRCLRLAERVTTGSSIMPQKRNPDVLELIRAGAARLRARADAAFHTTAGLASSYHRDLQLAKEPFLLGLEEARALLAVTPIALTGIEVDPDRCRALLTRASAATDEVYRRVREEGVPFRTAYREVARDPEAAVTLDPNESWQQRTHQGAPGALRQDLPSLRQRLTTAQGDLERRRAHVLTAWNLLSAALGGGGRPVETR
ncbi:MAG: argininosuccinate lyase [Thermoanaerobaculia bacterium]